MSGLLALHFVGKTSDCSETPVSMRKIEKLLEKPQLDLSFQCIVLILDFASRIIHHQRFVQIISCSSLDSVCVIFSNSLHDSQRNNSLE